MPGKDGRWRAPITHSLQWMAWPWCTLGTSREMVMHPEKKIIKMAGSRPALQPSPSVLQKALQQPTEHTRHWERSHIHALRRTDTSDMSCHLSSTSCKVGGECDWSFLSGLNNRERLRKAINGSNLNGRWRRQDISFSLWHCLSICTLFESAKHQVK